MCLLVGWEAPRLILLPAERLAALLQGGEGFYLPAPPSAPLICPRSQPRGELLSGSKQPGAILPCPRAASAGLDDAPGGAGGGFPLQATLCRCFLRGKEAELRNIFDSGPRELSQG